MKKQIVSLLNCFIAKKQPGSRIRSGMTVMALLLVFLILPITSYAQTLKTQKQVVAGFKIADIGQYFPFRQSDCSLKNQGDANCDRIINQFDLSVWQVEANSMNNPRRADFNDDGVVNLVDFGIWRGTFYPQKVSLLPDCRDSIVKLLYCYIAKTQIAFQQFNNSTIQQFLPSYVNAQERQTKPAITDSSAFTFASGDSQITNSDAGGNLQQISFDQNGNIAGSRVFNGNGNMLAAASYLASGDEVVSAIEDGVSVQIVKTAQGPVFQFFKDGAGTILAIKSWPNLESMDNNDPPLSVTLPAKGGDFLTLNINPNGSSIIVKTDSNGKVLNQTQTRKDGTYSSEDLRFKIFSQADKNGLSTIEMENNLGGKTTYNFYKSGLYALVQTDKDGNYYIAKPVDETGGSWNLSSTINGQTTQTQTSDPIAQIGSTSPSAKEIIKDINFFKSLPANAESINFSDGFGQTAQVLPEQISQANEILKIASSSLPEVQQSSWNFGMRQAFAKEVDVESVAEFPKEDDDNKGNSKDRTGNDDKGNSNSDGSSASAGAAAAAPATTGTASVGIGANTGNVTVAASGSQSTEIKNSSGATIATGASGQNASNAKGAGTEITPEIKDVVSRFIPAGASLGTPAAEAPRGPTTCFLAGTLISTPNGPKAIESLKPGGKVYSFNEKTGQKEIADFDKLDINFVDEYLILNGTIQTTTYHPFYTVILDWRESSGLSSALIQDPGKVRLDSRLRGNDRLLTLVKAGKLKVGDLLVDESNNLVPISSIQKITKKQTVYNLLTVTPNDNFYAQGILVHNYNSDNQNQTNVQADSSWSDPGYSSTAEPGNDNNNSSTDQTVN